MTFRESSECNLSFLSQTSTFLYANCSHLRQKYQKFLEWKLPEPCFEIVWIIFTLRKHFRGNKTGPQGKFITQYRSDQLKNRVNIEITSSTAWKFFKNLCCRNHSARIKLVQDFICYYIIRVDDIACNYITEKCLKICQYHFKYLTVILAVWNRF